MIKLGITKDLPNSEYHADREYLSSSVIKLLYKDIEEYHRKYILRERDETPPSSALLFGSYMHSLILEPHLVKEQYAVYQGLRRAGAEYESFVEKNKGKIIISKPEQVKAEAFMRMYNNHPIASSLFEHTERELTLTGQTDGIKTKCRFDAISPEKGIILDIKTTGQPANKQAFLQTCNKLSYFLSAALYAELAKKEWGKHFDFYFVVFSKTEMSLEIYKTSKKSYENGKKQVEKGISNYKKAVESGLWINTYEPEIIEEEEEYIIEEI